jgi:hypothetical protein
MARTLTITVEVDDKVDQAVLERTVEQYNEGAVDDVVMLGFGGQIFRFEEVTHFEYTAGPADEDADEDYEEISASQLAELMPVLQP